MSKVQIATAGAKRNYRPGEELSGVAGWLLERAPEKVELRLFWHTQGKGTEDVVVVETVPFGNPQPEEARPFQIRIPDAPYSFSGRLISLLWALELIVKPGNKSDRLEIVVSPTGEEILLDQSASPRKSI